MTITHPLGEIVRDTNGRVALRFERNLSHPPERVWRALTESDQLRHWMPCDVVGPREEGAELEVRFWDDVVAMHGIEESVLPGRILTWDPPRRLVWEWDDEILTFVLEPRAGGTRLMFTVHIGSRAPGAELVAAGYHVCLDQLVALVDTGEAPPFLEADSTPYVTLYAPIAERLQPTG